MDLAHSVWRASDDRPLLAELRHLQHRNAPLAAKLFCSWLYSFRHRAAVASRVRARMARCSTRGPCAAVRWGRQAHQRSRQGYRLLFARTGEDMDVRGRATQEQLPKSCQKARPRLTDLPGMDARQAPSGVSFSLGYFSFGQAKEKCLGPRSGSKRCCSVAPSSRIERRKAKRRWTPACAGVTNSGDLGSGAAAPPSAPHRQRQT